MPTFDGATMEEDVKLQKAPKAVRLSMGMLSRGEGEVVFFGFVEGENQMSRRLRHVWVEDVEWGERRVNAVMGREW